MSGEIHGLVIVPPITVGTVEQFIIDQFKGPLGDHLLTLWRSLWALSLDHAEICMSAMRNPDKQELRSVLRSIAAIGRLFDSVCAIAYGLLPSKGKEHLNFDIAARSILHYVTPEMIRSKIMPSTAELQEALDQVVLSWVWLRNHFSYENLRSISPEMAARVDQIDKKVRSTYTTLM